MNNLLSSKRRSGDRCFLLPSAGGAFFATGAFHAVVRPNYFSGRSLSGAIAAFLVAATGISPASAELQILKEQPWLGYHSGYADKKYKIGLAGDGKITLTIIGEKAAPVSELSAITIVVCVAEVLPDGKTVMRQMKPESLESAQAPTDQLEKTVITGKVAGDAVFEFTLEQIRGVISMGGRLIDPGTLVKNPLHFTVSVKFPSVYSYDLKGDKLNDKKELKAFEKKVENDHIDMKWTDGKRKKQTFEEAVDAGSADINGPGISGAEIDVGAYKGKKFLIMASGNSAMKLWNPKAAPLHEGFSIHWQPDSALDKEGKSRITIDVR